MSSCGTSIGSWARRDCAYQLRIDYELPRPIALEELDELVEHGLSLHRFSAFVAGARDHFQFRACSCTLVEGQIGGHRLQVTYGKLGRASEPRDREEFEEALGRIYQARVSADTRPAAGD